VQQTARRVGFSDAASFSRAFQRWTGRSPGSVARAAREDGS
jgi:AraC-like DNA-binding protein